MQTSQLLVRVGGSADVTNGGADEATDCKRRFISLLSIIIILFTLLLITFRVFFILHTCVN